MPPATLKTDPLVQACLGTTKGLLHPCLATPTPDRRLPHTQILMVGGVAKTGCANFYVDLQKCATANNPTIEIYDPNTR